MGTMRLIVVMGVLALLAACASPPRPDADESSTTRAVAPPPIETSIETSAPVAAPVAEPEPVIEAPAVIQPTPPLATTPVQKPVAAPVAKPPTPAPAAKVVKAPKPVKADAPAASPAKAPKPVSAKPPATAADAEVRPEAPMTDASANRIQGKLELIAGSGQSLGADDMNQAVVYFVPDTPTAKAKPGRFRIYTHNKQFEPSSMVIPLGSTITFPNQDEILHNVFSVTPQSSFDLGIYGEGKSADYSFKKTGLVLINCNVHQAMQANVLVVDTSYIVKPDKQGRFTLANLPAGSGKLAIWHPRASVQEQIVSLPLARPVSLRLVLTKPRVTEHLNKERKAYR